MASHALQPSGRRPAASSTLAERGWAVRPEAAGDLLVFTGNRLHGVLPGGAVGYAILQYCTVFARCVVGGQPALLLWSEGGLVIVDGRAVYGEAVTLRPGMCCSRQVPQRFQTCR